MARDQTGFHLDMRGLAGVLQGGEMAAAMAAAAERGRAWAQAEAERNAYITGTYARSFEVETRIEKVNGINRQIAVLVNRDPKAWAVEWGNGGHHILQRAVDVIKKGKG